MLHGLKWGRTHFDGINKKSFVFGNFGNNISISIFDDFVLTL